MTQEPRAGRPLPTGVDHLRSIVDHHVWATLRLIDRCKELAPEQLELSTRGTYGSIHATLAHLVQSDRGYQRRMLGEERAAGWQAPLATLRADMERQGGRWHDLLERVDEVDATMPAEPESDPPYPEVEHAVGLFFTQAVHHGEEHRSHVCTILGSHGLEVPDLSGWEYFRLVTHARAAGGGS